MAAFTQCAQVITLRTQLMPEVFEGNPTSVSISSGKKLRTIQWGSQVYAAANFDVSADQNVTLPEGIWYDYLNGAVLASDTYSLKPGELKVFTSTPVEAPQFSDISKRDRTAVENVQGDKVQSTKVLRNGQMLIYRGGRTYDVTGRVVE